MRHRVIRGAAAVVATLAVAGPATAETPAGPQWNPAAVQEIPAVDGFQVESVAVGRVGSATVGISRVTPAGVVPAVLERPGRGSTWRRPVAVSGATRIDHGPVVARNRRGDAVAVWGSANGPAMAAVRFGTRWSKPAPLGMTLPSISGEDVHEVIGVAMGDDRRARVAVRRCGRRCLIDLRRLRRPARPAWLSAGRLVTPVGSQKTLGWALGGGGHLLAAWRQGRRVRALRVGPADSVAAAVPERVPVSNARGGIAVDVTPRGVLAVGWSTVKGAAGSSVRLSDDADWRRSRTASRAGGAGDPRIAVGCDGGVFSSWRERGGVVRAATASGLNGLFTAPFEVKTWGDEDARPPTVWDVQVIGRTGFGLSVWRRPDGGGAGAVGSMLGDRSQYAARGQGFSGTFRDGPAPVFNDEGRGLLVRIVGDEVRFQEYEPGETVLRCA